MIDKIGPKRTMTLGVLAGLLALFALLNYLVFLPKTEQTQNVLNGVQSETSTMQTEIEKMRADFIVAEKQKVFFDSIKRRGFFNNQDRVLARERFDTLQKLSKIISARYEIRAANIISDESADKTGYVVMESPIVVSLSAIDDLDVYRFIYYLNYGFPGHITIDNVTIERKLPVTSELLKLIGTGTPPEIITAKLDINWRTMAKKDEVLTGTTDVSVGQPGVPQAGGAN